MNFNFINPKCLLYPFSSGVNCSHIPPVINVNYFIFLQQLLSYKNKNYKLFYILIISDIKHYLFIQKKIPAV